MKNILIPTDFSENSWNAIIYAFQFFSKSACNFYFLHVDTSKSSLIEKVAIFSETKHSNQVLVQSSKELLKQLILRVKNEVPVNSNHKFFTISDKNNIIDSIRNQVLEKQIQLIVMGTKGISELKNLPIGSNTCNVITKVKCAALVVPENAKYKEPKEIVFPTDFSIFYKTETLQPVSDLIEMNNASIRILHVNKNSDVLNDGQQKNKEFLNDYFTNHTHSFHFLKNECLEEALQNFVDAKEINLITMLAKNLNYFQKLLFHPNTKDINYYKNIPFLIVH